MIEKIDFGPKGQGHMAHKWSGDSLRLCFITRAMYTYARSLLWQRGWLGACHTPVLYQNGYLYPDFKVTTFFEVEYWKNGAS